MNNHQITQVKARKIFDSRGKEAIEIDVIASNVLGRSSSPSGASTGRWEVRSYPEGGVKEAIRFVEDIISPKIVGMELDVKQIDQMLHEMDKSSDFSRLGGNTAYAISLATARAGANSRGVPLFSNLSEYNQSEIPYPLGNVIGGGMHARGGKTDIQEFLVLPTKSETFATAAEANMNVHRQVADLLENKGVGVSGRGDEGAWVVPLETQQALEILSEACSRVSDETGVRLKIGLDMAASTLWDKRENAYIYQRDERKIHENDQIDFVVELANKFHLGYIEDPVHEESFEAFSEITAKISNTLICGDDLFTTNVERIKKGIKEKAGNAVIIKPNQIGTLTDAMETAKISKQANYIPVVSHRSGESCGSEISHLAVALAAPIIKLGVLGGERMAKINELIRIEEILGKEAKMAKIGI
ncbi:phosphopyruvate hydratase [[Eubacterium] cellulosolvens]